MFVRPSQPTYLPFSYAERTAKLRTFLDLCPHLTESMDAIDKAFSLHNPWFNDEAFLATTRLLNDHAADMKPKSFLAGMCYLIEASHSFPITEEHLAVVLLSAILFQIKNPELAANSQTFFEFSSGLAFILKFTERPEEGKKALIKAVICYSNSISTEFSDLTQALFLSKYLVFHSKLENKDIQPDSEIAKLNGIERDLIFSIASELSAPFTALQIIIDSISLKKEEIYSSRDVEITLKLMNQCVSPLHTLLDCCQIMSSSQVKSTCPIHRQFFMACLEWITKNHPTSLRDLEMMLQSIHDTFFELEKNSKMIHKIFECFYYLIQKYCITNTLSQVEIKQIPALFAKTFCIKPLWLHEAQTFCLTIYKKCLSAKFFNYDQFLFSIKMISNLIVGENLNSYDEARSQRYSSWLSINLAGSISGALLSPGAYVEIFEPRLILELVQEAFLSEWNPQEIGILKKIIVSPRIPIKYSISIITLVNDHKLLASEPFMALFLERVLNAYPESENLKMKEYLDVLQIFNKATKIDKIAFGQEHGLALAQLANLRWDFNQFFFLYDRRDRRLVMSEEETTHHYFSELTHTLDYFLEVYDIKMMCPRHKFVTSWLASIVCKLIQVEAFCYRGKHPYGHIMTTKLPIKEIKKDLRKILSHLCEQLVFFRNELKQNELNNGEQSDFLDLILRTSKEIYFEPILMLDELIQNHVEGITHVEGLGYFIKEGDVEKMIFSYDTPNPGEQTSKVFYGEL